MCERVHQHNCRLCGRVPCQQTKQQWSGCPVGDPSLHYFPVYFYTIQILCIYMKAAEKYSVRVCVCACLRLCWIHPLLLISCFSFPPLKVVPVILAICLFPCYTCLLSFQRSGRETDSERREKDGRGGGKKQSRLQLAGSTLCPVDSIWMQRKCSFPDSLEEQMEQYVERWMGAWLYVARPWKLTGCWLLLFYLHDRVGGFQI